LPATSVSLLVTGAAPVGALERLEGADRLQPGISRRLDRVFRISLVLKALDAVLEIVGGILLLFIAPRSIHDVARWAVAHDLAGSPHDVIARHLLHSANQLSASTTLFAAVYLLSHGVAKLALVVLVLRDKLWAYPWMIALLIAFIIYQVYRFTYRPGPGLVVLSVFDAFVAWLTWREYRAKRDHFDRRFDRTAVAPAERGRS
jgi:uncharacterized membrane protein